MKNQINLLPALIVLLLLGAAPVAASVTFIPSCPMTIAKGDTFTISGTGAANGTVTLWIVGRNYFSVVNALPDRAGNFTIILRPEDTVQFSSGQYAFVIQDPGSDGKTGIGYRSSNNGNITVLNEGIPIADLGPTKGIGADAEPVIRKLRTSTMLPGVDDILTPYYFFVEEPSVHFDQKSGANPDGQLPNLTRGEWISISGTTNMGVENSLRADIRALDTHTLISSTIIPVIAGTTKNRWAFDPDTRSLELGEYFVTVGWMKSTTTGTGSSKFSVVTEPGPAQLPLDDAASGAGIGNTLHPLAIAGGVMVLGIGAYVVTSKKRKT